MRKTLTLLPLFCVLLTTLHTQSTDTIPAEQEVYIYIEEPKDQPIYHIIENDQGKMGLYHFGTKTWIIEPVFEVLTWFPVPLPDALPEDKNKSPYLYGIKDGLKGLYKCNGTEVFPPKFKRLRASPCWKQDQTWIAVNTENRYGLLSITGDTILPFIHEEINIWKCNKFVLEYKGKRCEVDAQGKEIQPPTWYYPPLEVGGKTYYKAKHQDLFSLYNEQEELVLPFEFNSFQALTRSTAKIQHYTTGLGLYDANMKNLIPCQYEALEALPGWQIQDHVEKGKHYYLLARGKEDSLFAFIDTLGNALTPNAFHYHYSMRIINGVVFDVVDPGWTVLKSMQGKVLFPDTLFTGGGSGMRNAVYGGNVNRLARQDDLILAGRKSAEEKYALLNVKKGQWITPAIYDYFQLPFSRNEDMKIKLIVGVINKVQYLLRLDGRKLSNRGFTDVYLKNNPPDQLKDIANRPDVEALMRTADDKIFVLYQDDRIEEIK